MIGERVTSTARVFCLALLCAGAALCAQGVAVAQAGRPLISPALIPEIETKKVKGGQIEGACGIAIKEGQTFVSDYYHHAIDIFPGAGRITGNPLNGYCGLAFAPGGTLYANEWHEAVYAVSPTKALIDSGESTGVAVDQASGDLYVNDRTYIARYEAPIAPEEAPAQVIGLGSLEEGFGVAVEGGRVYVPDAATDTVKVYEPATDLTSPVLTITGPPAGGFISLRDAAITTDPTNGHVLVLDNLQPGFEFPEGGVDEFAPDGTFLGQLPRRVIDGEPSGLTTSAGNVYVTTGNSEEANVMKFGPYVSSPSSSLTPLAASVPESNGEMEERSALSTSSLAFVLHLTPAGAGAAQLTATVDSPGTLTASGLGLVPLKVSLTPGRHSLALHLNTTGKRALKRSKTDRLRVRVGVHFQAADGSSMGQSAIAAFKARAAR